MKLISNFLLTILLGIILSLFLPWWSIMLAAFLSGAIVRLKNTSAFFVPFFAMALFWIIQAWMMASANDFILTEKIGVLLQLGEEPILVILITGIIGGLAAGISGLFGNQTRAILAKEN